MLVLASCAMMAACAGRAKNIDHLRPHATAADRSALMSIAGHRFTLEVAATPEAIERGLGGHTSLAPNRGMLFIFDEAGPQAFVMRDCVIPLDLLYLDGNGRIIGSHAMIPEPPRTAQERASSSAGDDLYTARLMPYICLEPASYAVELKGGTIAMLQVRVGDVVTFTLHASPSTAP